MKRPPLTYSCSSCGDLTSQDRQEKLKGRCQECHDEIEHGKIPNVTGPSVNTPAGMCNVGDPDPGFENVQRAYEE